jgi:zinc D-Ala-D-Ala carboxypeptidase
MEDTPSILSDHFSEDELTITNHHEIANYPPSDIMQNLRELCSTALEKIRLRVGPLKVTSGYRCRVLDAAVAGPPFDHVLSAHQTGYAADIQPCSAGYSLRDVLSAALKSLPSWDQLIIEGGCVHVGLYAPYPEGAHHQRRQVFVRTENPLFMDDRTALRYRYEDFDPDDSNQMSRCV